MSDQVPCCPCDRRGKCGSCVCARSKKPCRTDCKNIVCNNKSTPKKTSKPSKAKRFQPYAATSSRNTSSAEELSRNDLLQTSCEKLKKENEELCAELSEKVDNLHDKKIKDIMKDMIQDNPHFVKNFIMPGPASSSDTTEKPQFCICGNCKQFEDARMNVCCNDEKCVTSNPTFVNVCLRRNVLEVANILNWSFQTNLEPDFRNNIFRNQAYRNFILWHNGKLGQGQRRPVPSCTCVAIRNKYPDENGVYSGYHSANTDSE